MSITKKYKECTEEQRQEQLIKMADLQKNQGYIYDKNLSIAYAAVILRKNDDLWVFGVNGEIDHNPHVIRIPIK